LATAAGGTIDEIIRRPDVALHAPELCDIEVTSGLRRALLRGEVSAARAAEALEDYLDLPLTRHGHPPLLPRVLELRANFTAYDACYVALAELLSADLLTADAPLRRAVLSHTQITVLP
jgi:predicted nucleic acid-binding protein